MTVSLYTEVHNKILELLNASPGIPLAWDSETGEVEALVDEEPLIASVSGIGPGGSDYTESANRREGMMRDRAGWEWGAEVKFDGAVDTEAFEASIAQSNSYPKNETDGIEGFIVELETLTVTEPPRQDGEGGTVLDLIFNVRTTRF